MQNRLTIYCIILLFALTLAVALPKKALTADVKIVTGTVIETMNASGYTYMLIAAGTVQSWVAIPDTTIRTGTEVSYYDGLVMSNFTSKTLDKTFEKIIFSAGLVETATNAIDSSPAKAPAKDDSFSAALQAEQKGAATVSPDTQTSGGSSVAIAPLQEISVPKAEGENAYTVEEIFAKHKEFAGKKIRLRGKVVKFSPNIMGKNWVHLQDGTGNPLQNSHDLVFTTDATLTVDAIITMEGILAADKDFGAGYKYTAIVEQAAIVK
jgi:hypothetical protein